MRSTVVIAILAALVGAMGTYIMTTRGNAAVPARNDAPISAMTADLHVLDGSEAMFAEGTVDRMIRGLSAEGYFDPSSAQFQTLTQSIVMDDREFICGFVNLKNRMGGYTGFAPFVFAMGSGNITVHHDDDEFAAIASRLALGLAECDSLLGFNFDD